MRAAAAMQRNGRTWWKGIALACVALAACQGGKPRVGPGLEPPSDTNKPPGAMQGGRAGSGTSAPPIGATAGSTSTPAQPTPMQDMDAGMTPSEPMPDAASRDAALPPVDVPPPEPVGCITDVSAGAHTFECDGITHDLGVAETCLHTQCGLVIDVHGGTMSSRMENKNTDMQRIGAEHGYVVLQPSAFANLWNADTDDAKVLAFAQDAIRAFHLDERRVHMMGFSQGGYMTWRFLCRHTDFLASAAPAAAAGEANISPEVGCTFQGSDVPAREIPVLYMHGHMDGMVAFDNARVLTEALRAAYHTGDGDVIAMDPQFTRTRYLSADGVPFEFIEHDYLSPSMVGVPPLGVAIKGHCYPGSEDWTPTEPDQLMAFGCEPKTELHWGEAAMAFFIAHPKRGE